MSRRTWGTPRRSTLVSALFLLVLTCLLSACGTTGQGATGTATTPTPTPILSRNMAPLSVYTASFPDMTSGEVGTISALDATTGKVRWQYKTSVVGISLTEANGTVYAHGSSFTAPDGGHLVYALRTTDGKLIWQAKLPNAASQSAPLPVDGRVCIVTSSDGIVYALDESTGKEVWKTSTGSGKSGVQFPQAANGIVYVTGIGAATLYALRVNDGKLLWKYEAGMGIMPPVHVEGNLVYAVNSPPGQSGQLLALKSSDGSVVWQKKGAGMGFSEMATDAQHVYVSASNGTITAFGASDGSQVWQVKTGGQGLTTPILLDGTVYASTTDTGTLYALVASSGKSIWQKALGSDAYLNLPTGTQGAVYITDQQGTVYGFQSSDGKELWHTPTVRFGDNDTTPQVKNGLLYLVNSGNGRVYALSTSDGSVRWHYDTGQPDMSALMPLVVD